MLPSGELTSASISIKKQQIPWLINEQVS